MKDLNILIIDDEQTQRDVLTGYLEKRAIIFSLQHPQKKELNLLETIPLI